MIEAKESISEQLLKNIQLDQYDQLSCSNPDSKIIASYGPLYKNDHKEIFFDLSKEKDFDDFHPLSQRPELKKKFKDTYIKSNRSIQIDNLLIELTKDCNNIDFMGRVITVRDSIPDSGKLLKHGIKGNYVDSKTIKLYLPLVIKDRYIRDIVSILEEICT
jgi:hypothetical protein